MSDEEAKQAYEASLAEKGKFRIAGDVINEAVQGLPEDQRAALKWFGSYCTAKKLSNSVIGQLLVRSSSGGRIQYYSYDSVYQALTGRRAKEGANLQPICDAIQTLRMQVEGVSRVGDSGFIETRLSQVITDRANRSRKRGRITFVFGDSQIGKSECFKHYAQNFEYGETVYIEVATGGSLPSFLEEMALALTVPPTLKQLRREIINKVNRNTLIIVDEAHRGLSADGKRGLALFDFLRELYNRTGCGMVIAMTNEGKKNFRTGRNQKSLEQLWRRRIAPLHLPSVPFEDDLAKFAEAYGLPPASDDVVTIEITIVNHAGREEKKEFSESSLSLQSRFVEAEGLGVWLSLLQDAADMAKTKRKPITWGAVLKAYCLDQAESAIIQ